MLFVWIVIGDGHRNSLEGFLDSRVESFHLLGCEVDLLDRQKVAFAFFLFSI